VFTDYVDEGDKPALYGGAIAFVWPSRYEGFGLPVLESLACGTPAVVARGSSLEEVGGPGAIAVAPGDEEAMAGALLQITRDEDLRRRLALAGLQHAATYSWDRTATRTLDVYRDALGIAAPLSSTRDDSNRR